MKKIYTILAAVLLTATTYAQTPEKMSYQAVVRDSGDALVTNQAVGMQISILQTTSTGTTVYVETQTPTTNINGLVTFEIGAGSVVSGDFTTIDWSADSYFIKTETDPTGGSSYSITGTSQLMSVPYALYAKTAETVTGGITETDPIFGASVASGITETDTTNWNNKQDELVAGTSDQTLRYDGTDWVASSALLNNGTEVTTANDITVNTVKVGRGSGNNAQNTAIGASALGTGTGSRNTAIGYLSLTNYSGTSTDNNTAVGYFSSVGITSGSQNTSLGAETLLALTTGVNTTAIGAQSLLGATGNNNTALGYRTGETLTTGSNNTLMGSNTNVAVGNLSNAMAIGANAIVDASNKVQIGDANVSYVQLGTSSSVTLETGLVKITGGSPGVSKVLTSDATGNATWETPAVPTTGCGLSIGDTYQGGIIFYLDASGCNGLTVSLQDLSGPIEGWVNPTVDAGARGNGIGSGYMNTILIVTNQGYPAAANLPSGLCANYSVLDGISLIGDWYLPSIEELKILAANEATINAGLVSAGGSIMSSGSYWSSTERDATTQWFNNFGGLGTNSFFFNKNNASLTRAIRKF